MENTDYQRIEKAIRYIEENTQTQPTLDAIANHIGLSPYHFQKLFTRWVGVSPKRFLQYLTVASAKELLKNSSVLDTSLELGLSGPSRLHDHFINAEAVTPGEFKSSGNGLDIRYGFHPSPFGECLIAETSRGVCHLSFAENDIALSELRKNWENANILEDRKSVEQTVKKIFYKDSDSTDIKIYMKGTNFQIKVWQALLRIPEGVFVSYSTIAKAIGHPKSSRAVGTAIGQNNIGYLIPCHRVLRTTGDIGGYRWGTDRKKAIIAFEAATTSRS